MGLDYIFSSLVLFHLVVSVLDSRRFLGSSAGYKRNNPAVRLSLILGKKAGLGGIWKPNKNGQNAFYRICNRIYNSPAWICNEGYIPAGGKDNGNYIGSTERRIVVAQPKRKALSRS